MLTGAWDMRAGTRNMLTGARDMRAGAGQIIKDGNVLLAMKRQDFERRAQDAPNLDWLTSKTVGVLSVGLPRPSFAAPETMQEVPVATYHVMIQDGKLSVEVENDPGRRHRRACCRPGWWGWWRPWPSRGWASGSSAAAPPRLG